jgi:hypothetical protein
MPTPHLQNGRCRPWDRHKPVRVCDSGRLGPDGSARGRLADVDHPVNAELVLEQAEFVAPNASAIASWSAAERYRSAAASHALTRTLNCA